MTKAMNATSRPGIGHSDYLAARQMMRKSNAGLTGFLILTLSTLIAAGVGWMAWAEVSEVVTAEGRVEPAGKAKLINHARGGKVAVLHVADGTRVSKGDALVTLDAQMTTSEREELRGRYEVAAFTVERLRAEAEGRDLDPSHNLALSRPELLAAEQALLAARQEAFTEKARALTKTITAREEDLRSSSANFAKLENSFNLVEQQLAAVSELYARGLYPKLKLVALERQLSDVQGERDKAEAALAGARAALAEAKAKKSAATKENRRDILAELGAATAERDQIWERLQSHNTLLSEMVVRAPIDGIVQDVAITSAGQSIGAHLPMMKLVPLGTDMVVQADVANQDIGKLTTDMAAAIKVHAFDFTRYGTIDGKVAQIAADSHQTRDDGALTYRVKIKPEAVDDTAKIELRPGMLVNVELQVGERTILSYITDQIIDWQGKVFTES